MSDKNVTPSTTETSGHKDRGVSSHSASQNGDRLQEIRARLDAATPGPWTNDDGWTVSSGPNRFYVTGHAVVPADADLIAHAPADIAWLLDEVERARRSGRAWRGLARRLKQYKEQAPFDERPHGYHRQVAEAEWRAAIGKETPFDIAILGGSERVHMLRPVWKANIRQIRARAKRLRAETDNA